MSDAQRTEHSHEERRGAYRSDALPVLNIASNWEDIMNDLKNYESQPAENCLTVSVTAAAKRLGISRGSAYKAVRSGELPVIRMGDRILVPSAALDRMLQVSVRA